jgi:hypothetical protein
MAEAMMPPEIAAVRLAKRHLDQGIAAQWV